MQDVQNTTPVTTSGELKSSTSSSSSEEGEEVNPMDKQSPELKFYKDKLESYLFTVNHSAGCGPRVQGYIDKAYDELVYAHQRLSPVEHDYNVLPRKAKSWDDGTGGIQTGISYAVADMFKQPDGSYKINREELDGCHIQ